jgi:hypothetical protein
MTRKQKCACGHRSQGHSEKDFDMKKVLQGAKIEFEHTCDFNLSKRISMDHLAESDQYYSELEKMEKKLMIQSRGKEFVSDMRKCTTSENDIKKMLSSAEKRIAKRRYG